MNNIENNNNNNNLLPVISILDYGAGNITSIINAIKLNGYSIHFIKNINDIKNAKIIIFPGVGNFTKAIHYLNEHNLFLPLKEYIKQNKPYLGICLGMQTLFEYSEESENICIKGLNIIPGKILYFRNIPLFNNKYHSVPHIGWNGLTICQNESSFLFSSSSNNNNINNNNNKVYFVHSYCVIPSDLNIKWICTTTDYGNIKFISSIRKDNIFATQFHPEKSGKYGLSIIKEFLNYSTLSLSMNNINIINNSCINKVITYDNIQKNEKTNLAKRIIVCLDVRENDEGTLVVTKGDQYNVREDLIKNKKNNIRNMGNPIDLCEKYYKEGIDEIIFLNITGYKNNNNKNQELLLSLLKECSKKIFIPLTIGGGIQYNTINNNNINTLHLVEEYFRSGADKISIGSDAVYASEEYYKNNNKNNKSSIQIISNIYGKQAVIVSLDPKKVYVTKEETKINNNPSIRYFKDFENLKNTTNNNDINDNDNDHLKYYWYQATVKGGREGRMIDIFQVAKACEIMGAGEILLNSVNNDGQKKGYDHTLINTIKETVKVPVIASSGAGTSQHFVELFRETNCEAALAAGIFHRNEVKINDLKKHLIQENITIRS